MRVEVAADARLAAVLAAKIAADAMREAIDTRGRAAIAVSGGTTPARMLEELAGARLPWRDVHIFQADERMVGRHDPGRNLRGLIRAFAASPIAAPHMHGMPVDEPDSRAAACAYRKTLRTVLGPSMRLDVVHLGLGTDGHTASLVRDDPALESAEDVAVTALYQGTRRMTLTLGMLNRARLRLWLVTGVSKRAVLKRLISGDPELVAARVNRVGSCIVADSAAAGRV